jgi:hypothetical protein
MLWHTLAVLFMYALYTLLTDCAMWCTIKVCESEEQARDAARILVKDEWGDVAIEEGWG